MVDEEIQDVPAGPTGAPVNRDARREPDVIEGEIAARETDDSQSPPRSTPRETIADPPPAKASPRAGARSLLGGAIAGLIVSALRATTRPVMVTTDSTRSPSSMAKCALSVSTTHCVMP